MKYKIKRTKDEINRYHNLVALLKGTGMTNRESHIFAANYITFGCTDCNNIRVKSMSGKLMIT